MIHLDFETRSAVDLKAVGAYAYAEHPTTEILCAAWDSGDRTRLWYPDKWDIDCDPLDDLIFAAGMGEDIAAFNAQFERLIWNHKLTKHGGAVLPIERFYCVATAAYAISSPRTLGQVAQALGLPQEKDKAGRAIMLKMSKPRKPRKGEPKNATLWHESRDDLEALGGYCKQDVVVEKAIYKRIPRLTPRELEIYYADQRINDRGFGVDLETARAAVDVVEAASARAERDIARLTGGAVERATQAARVVKWLRGRGIEMPNMQAKTIDDMLAAGGLELDVAEVLRIRRQFGRSASKKFQAVIDRACNDGRIRGSLVCCGATRTRRWSGQGVQPQNMAKGFEDPAEQAFALKLIQSRDLESLGFLFLSAMQALGDSARGIVRAKEGCELLVSDFSAIEAVVLACISRNWAALDVIAAGRDQYKEAASFIFGIPVDQIAKDSIERFVGKQAVLACGYGMGWKKYQERCALYGRAIPTSLAKKAVDGYRELNNKVVKFWHQIERDAIRCVARGTEIQREFYRFRTEDLGLVMTLPNGSERYYLGAKVQLVDKWKNGEPAPVLTYLGVQEGKLTRVDTWGGKLTENIVQGISREIEADALLGAEADGFHVVLHTHDELVCEELIGERNVEELETVMGYASLGWAKDWPIKAVGWKGKRYRK